jgi:hypothetical protein
MRVIRHRTGWIEERQFRTIGSPFSDKGRGDSTTRRHEIAATPSSVQRESRKTADRLGATHVIFAVRVSHGGFVMIDRYTKFVLTVIAVSLAILAAGTVVPRAGAQIGGGCGGPMSPCFIATPAGIPLSMRLER